MSELSLAIRRIAGGKELSSAQAEAALAEVMRGEAIESQCAALLSMLSLRGETSAELTGFARAMRAAAVPVKTSAGPLIDTCGTGGDGMGSFNISTAAAFIAAGMGLFVAKHGNRAASGRCGSADVLEALGVNIELEAEQMARCIEQAGIGFLYAPRLHPAMKHCARLRRELGFRTAFNMLGPLVNPAGARRQLVGAYSPQAAELIAGALLLAGCQHALVVHGEDGMDEISITAPTLVLELRDGAMMRYHVTPQSLGLRSADASTLAGGDAACNAELIGRLLEGEAGPRREVALANAAAAACIGGLAGSIAEGVELARASIDSGRALQALLELKRVSQPAEARA